MDYHPLDNGLEAQFNIAPDKIIRFLAKNIRMERTGVHASVSIALNTTRLAWSNFNVERDEDRGRLARAAHKDLTDLRITCSVFEVKHNFDTFCAGLWEASLGLHDAGEMEGTEERQEVTFLLKPYVLSKGGTILFGPPGAGKSNIALAMAVTIDAGLNGIWQTEQRKVMYVNLERPADSLALRLGNINEALGLPRKRPLSFFHSRGRPFSSIYDSAGRYIKRHNIGLIILDSISRMGQGSMVKDEAVNSIIDQLNNICPAWLALGHTPRDDTSHVWGLQLFDAGADCMVKLTSSLRDNDDLGVCLQITKANDFLPPHPTVYKFALSRTGVTAFGQDMEGDFADLLPGPTSMREEIMDYLADTGEATATQIAKATNHSRSKTATLLRSDKKTFIPCKGQGGRGGQYYGLAMKGN